jgi:hypothetical protein
VVDPSGRDAYLHVQYVWDDEEYVEDFPPDRVRRAGQMLTVEDMIRSGELSSQRVDPAMGSSSNSGYHPAAASRADELAEVVLDCVEAEGVNLDRISLEHKAIALQVKHGSLYGNIGRQHQPEFFERLVLEKDYLTSISRSHFELSWEPSWAAPKLRQLSRNKLLVESRMVTVADSSPISLPEGTRIAFCASADSDVRFLILRLHLRSRATVDSSGMHPAVMASQQQALGGSLPMTMHMGAQPMRAVAAVLECVNATGTDLARVPPDVKAIPIEFDKSLDIGRNHQARVFEELLKADSSQLSFISRTHCRVRLYKGPPPAQAGGAPRGSQSVLLLEVENLSMNVLFVAGQPLPKNGKTSIAEGSTISFSAAVTGEDTKFLEFMLRRARLVA